MVAVELADEFYVRCLTAARASAGELEERGGELAVLYVGLDIYKVLFGFYACYAVVPVFLNVELSLQRLHGEGFHALLAGAYVNAVAAAEAVEDVYGLDEVHTLERGTECRNGTFCAEGSCLRRR